MLSTMSDADFSVDGSQTGFATGVE
jgi:hypothetical protein